MGGREFWLVKLDFDDEGRQTIEFTEIDWVIESTELRIDDTGTPHAYILLSRSTEETSLRTRMMDAGVSSPRIKAT